MSMQVLVVDDEPRVAATIALLLKRSNVGCQVRTAPTGEAAVDTLAQEAADIVITDYRMPGMDGLQLTAHIREHYPQTMVILLTAFGSPAVTVQAEQAGVARILRKPFEVHELLTAVRQAAAHPQDSRPA